jgi:hypothetical protein
MQAQLEEKQSEVDRITNSLGWRLLRPYGKFKHGVLLPIYRLLQPGSANRKK